MLMLIEIESVLFLIKKILDNYVEWLNSLKYLSNFPHLCSWNTLPQFFLERNDSEPPVSHFRGILCLTIFCFPLLDPPLCPNCSPHCAFNTLSLPVFLWFLRGILAIWLGKFVMCNYSLCCRTVSILNSHSVLPSVTPSYCANQNTFIFENGPWRNHTTT